MNKLNVLVSLITKENDYQLEQAASAEAAAAKLGAIVQIVYAGHDAVQETQQSLATITDPAKRPDAIIAQPAGTRNQQFTLTDDRPGMACANTYSSAEYL